MKRTSKFNDLQNMVNYLGNLEDKADNASDIITKGMDHKIHPSNNLPKNLSDTVHKTLEVHGIAILSSLTEITSSAIANSVSEYAVSRVDNLRARTPRRAMTHKALNGLLQGSAADLMKKAMVDKYEAGVFDVLIPHLTVHDEMNVSVPKTKEGEEAFKEMVYIMENAMKLSVPVLAAANLGSNWDEAK